MCAKVEMAVCCVRVRDNMCNNSNLGVGVQFAAAVGGLQQSLSPWCVFVALDVCVNIDRRLYKFDIFF